MPAAARASAEMRACVVVAGCVIVVVPVVVLFVIAQRQLVGGLGEGALKG